MILLLNKEALGWFMDDLFKVAIFITVLVILAYIVYTTVLLGRMIFTMVLKKKQKEQ